MRSSAMMLCARTMPAANYRSTTAPGTSQLSEKIAAHRAAKFLVSQTRHIEANFRHVFGVPTTFPRIIGGSDLDGSTAAGGLFSNAQRPEGTLFHVTTAPVTSSLSLSLETAFEGTQKVKCSVRYALSPCISVVLASASSASIHNATFTALCRTLLLIPNERALNRLVESLSGYELRVLHAVHEAHGSQMMFSVVRSVAALPREPHSRPFSLTHAAPPLGSGATPQRSSAVAPNAPRRVRAATASPWAKIVVHSTLLSDVADFEHLGTASTTSAAGGGVTNAVEECRSLRFRRNDISFYASVICTTAVSPPVSTLWGALRNASRNAFNVLSGACGTPLLQAMELALEREVLSLARTAARGDSDGAYLSQFLAGSLQESRCSSDGAVAMHSLVTSRTKRTRLPLREYRLITTAGASLDVGDMPHRVRGFLQGDFVQGGRLPLCCKFTENSFYLGATPSSASILRSFVFAEAPQAGVTSAAPSVALNSLLPHTADLVRSACSVCAFLAFGCRALEESGRSPSVAFWENRHQVDAILFRVCVAEGRALAVANDLRLRTPLFELEGRVALEADDVCTKWAINATDVAGVNPLLCVYAVLSRYSEDAVARCSCSGQKPTPRGVDSRRRDDERSRIDVVYATLMLTDATSAAFRRLRSRQLNASLVDFVVVAFGGSCTLALSSTPTSVPLTSTVSRVAGCAFASPLLMWTFDSMACRTVSSGSGALASSTVIRANDSSSVTSSIEVGNVPVMIQAMRDMLQLDVETGIPRLLVNQPVVYDLARTQARIAAEQTVLIDTSAEVTLSWPTAPQWTVTLSNRDSGGSVQSDAPQQDVLGLIMEVTTELYRLMMSHAHPGLDYAAVPVPTIIVRQPGTRKALDFLMYAWFGATPIERHVVLRRHEVVLQSPHPNVVRRTGDCGLEGGITPSLPATGAHIEIHRCLLLYDVLGVRLLLAGVHATDMPRANAAIDSTIATHVFPDQRNLRITRHSQRYSISATGDKLSSSLLFYVQKLHKMGMVFRLFVTVSEATGQPLIEAQILPQNTATGNRKSARTQSALLTHPGSIFSCTIAHTTVKEDFAMLRNGEDTVPHLRQPLKTLEALCVEALSAKLTADRMDWFSRVAEKCRVSVVRNGFPVRYDPTFYAPSNLLGEALQGIQGRYECIYHTTSGCDVVCRVVITAVCGVPVQRRGWDPQPGEATARNVPPAYLVLGIGTGRTNRAAWRAAALDALQQNFPELLDEVASIRDLSDTLRGAPFGQLRAQHLHLPFRIRRWTDEAGRICCALRDDQSGQSDAENDVACSATGHPLDALVGRGSSTAAALRGLVTAVTEALQKPCSVPTVGSFSDWDVTSNYSKSALHAYLGALGTPLKAKMRWYVLPQGSAASGWFEIVCERTDATNRIVPSRIYPMSSDPPKGGAAPQKEVEWDLAVGQQLLCGLFGLLRHWAKLLPRATQKELSDLLQHLGSSCSDKSRRSFRISKRHYIEQRLRSILGVQVECRVGCIGQTWVAGAYAYFPANPRHVFPRPSEEGQVKITHHFVAQRIVVHCFDGQGTSEVFALDDLIRAMSACEAYWLVHEPVVGA